MDLSGVKLTSARESILSTEFKNSYFSTTSEFSINMIKPDKLAKLSLIQPSQLIVNNSTLLTACSLKSTSAFDASL